jgi:hypothetical protein
MKVFAWGLPGLCWTGQGGTIAPPIGSGTGGSTDACTGSTSPPAVFARRFEDAFNHLDRERGGHNFLSLVQLRQALADVPRAAFDAELRALLLAGRFSLSAAEGRHGLTVEERTAGIVEDGILLLYASRRQG